LGNIGEYWGILKKIEEYFRILENVWGKIIGNLGKY
jgi:hypothetical protein